MHWPVHGQFQFCMGTAVFWWSTWPSIWPNNKIYPQMLVPKVVHFACQDNFSITMQLAFRNRGNNKKKHEHVTIHVF